MAKLIAAVATAVFIEGQRVVIQAGEELPDLGEHDERALTSSGAAFDPEVARREQRAEERQQERGQAEFQAARDLVQQEQASTQLPAGTEGQGTQGGGSGTDGEAAAEEAARQAAAAKTTAAAKTAATTTAKGRK